MPQEEEEAPRSRRSRARRRRRRSHSGCPTPPTVATRSRASQLDPPSLSGPSQLGKRKRRDTATGPEVKESAEEQAVAVDSDSTTPDAHTGRKRTGTTRLDVDENAKQEEAAAASASTSPDPGPSSAVSSPLCWPALPEVITGENEFGDKIYEPFHKIDPAIVEAHVKLQTKCFAKQDRQLKLASLDNNVRRSCLADPKLVNIRPSVTKTVLQIAKITVGLSSYLDDMLLMQSSGFVIEWDANTKSCAILTSALLIQSSSSVDEWLGLDEYAPDAKVCVQLADKTDSTVVADLVHYDRHYNLALFRAAMDLSAQIPSFSTELKYAQEVFVLGRDKDRNLSVDHGSVVYEGPSCYLRHHYMFTSCGINMLGIGGPLINIAGEIVGMASLSEMAFIPSSIIVRCLRMWKKFNCIPRPHVGMKLSAITLLDLARIERISRKCDIDDGLIVTLVSEGSAAEKLGVRPGDIITSWNGENISTTIELETFLLHMCEEHLDKGNSNGSNVDVSIGIFHIRNDSHSIKTLTVNVSNDVEVVAEGTYPVTAAHCSSPCDGVERQLVKPLKTLKVLHLAIEDPGSTKQISIEDDLVFA
ncbi:hypothetical protein U9M48_041917 [Paspalum notatum var. saurae]|uniref:PDZ domain-containing protein n=1 Tax=Paspalum notatum var. saurae TaxID=547442 RepID=A0AAQ3XEQ7_PASNO